MSKKLQTFKNIIWAIVIAGTLLALLVGFLFAIFSPYAGDKERPVLVLGESLPAPKPAEQDKSASSAEETEPGKLMQLGETADAGQAYIDSLTFLSDSRLIGMRDYGLLTGGSTNMQVWGTSSGSFMISAFTTGTIQNPSDHSEITVDQAAMIIKPDKLVIIMGSDGLVGVTEELFKENYRALVQSIMEASPDTKIICCAVLPVISGYTGIDGLNATVISNANDWVMEVSAELGVYYADIRYAVKDKSGNLSQNYAGSNGKSINTQGIEQVLQYLRTHAL